MNSSNGRTSHWPEEPARLSAEAVSVLSLAGEMERELDRRLPLDEARAVKAIAAEIGVTEAAAAIFLAVLKAGAMKALAEAEAR